jgi:uncharacterized protein (DUF2147 family)
MPSRRPPWLLIALLAAVPPLAWGAPPSPVGTWRTFDDDGRESGLVAIRSENGALVGTILAIADPAKKGAVCRACTGALKDAPVVGMRVLWGVRPDGAEWDGGRILDPKTGDIYHVSMHLTDAGARLVLRGFIGISLFGRTQTWVRAGS